MKKFFTLTAIIALIGVTAKAQSTTFGIKATAQNNFLSIKEKTGSEWQRQVISGFGFNVGGVADIKFTSNFSIQPQLLFTSKSTQQSSAGKINIFTLDLPINFLYKTNGFFIGVGPNLSYGLSAKIKVDGDPEQDLYEDGGSASFNRFEFGANALIGYQCPSGLVLSANYTPGLSDLNNTDGTDARYNTRVFGFSIGYMFGGHTTTKKK